MGTRRSVSRASWRQSFLPSSCCHPGGGEGCSLGHCEPGLPDSPVGRPQIQDRASKRPAGQPNAIFGCWMPEAKKRLKATPVWAIRMRGSLLPYPRDTGGRTPGPSSARARRGVVIIGAKGLLGAYCVVGETEAQRHELTSPKSGILWVSFEDPTSTSLSSASSINK